jgi:arylsulfatase A-like enzyme
MKLQHVSLILSLLICSHATTASANKKQKLNTTKPNILWVLTDDQRMDSIAAFNRMTLGQSDSKLGKVLSPNVDELAAQGVTYLNTFNQNPGCAPSRTSMHTGRYSHKTGIYGFDYYAPDKMPHWRPMIPQVLRDEAGYQTVSVGKQGLRYKDRQSNLYEVELGGRSDFTAKGLYEWDKPKGKNKNKPGALYKFPDGKVLNWPFDHKKDPMDMDEIITKLDLLHAYPKGIEHKEYTKNVIGGVSPQGKDETRDGWYTEELVNYFKHANQKYTTNTGLKISGPDTNKPMFAYLGIEAPHTPVLPPAEFRKQFQNIKYNVPEFTQEELNGFPAQIRKLYKNNRSNHYTDQDKQQMIADYYAFTAYADYLVGKAVDGFVEYSENNNQPWMVLYVCGDHGWRLNDHGMVSKFAPFDIDLHNPMIVVSSDKKTFPAGKVVKEFTQFIDMAPTFFAAGGIDIEHAKYDYLDGQDLAKVTHKQTKRDYIIAEPTAVTGPVAVIRTADYKFAMKIRPGNKHDTKNIDWAITAKLKDIEPMLFDLRVDPREVNNLAFDPHYRPVLNALRIKLQDVVLGDGRIEVLWDNKGKSHGQAISNFAPGADDGKINVPDLVVKN